MLFTNIMLAFPALAHNNGFRILGISGSGRKASYNTALLGAAKKLTPDGVVLEIYDVSKLTLYNEDLEADMPAAVRDFKQKINDVDAILFATPEYNYTISAL